jgi:hypothetical protein
VLLSPLLVEQLFLSAQLPEAFTQSPKGYCHPWSQDLLWEMVSKQTSFPMLTQSFGSTAGPQNLGQR